MTGARGDEDGRARERSGAPDAEGGNDPAYDDPEAPVICEVCGGVMEYTASCKLRCPRCGYMRDCSDP